MERFDSYILVHNIVGVIFKMLNGTRFPTKENTNTISYFASEISQLAGNVCLFLSLNSRDPLCICAYVYDTRLFTHMTYYSVAAAANDPQSWWSGVRGCDKRVCSV